MKPRILVVAADVQLRATLARWLTAAGYGVELAEGLKRAREVAAGQAVSLAIVGPDRLGDVSRNLASEVGGLAANILTIGEPEGGTAAARGSAGQRIPSPISQEGVLATVSAVLGRGATAVEQEEHGVLEFEGYRVDVGARTCRDMRGQDIQLTRAEFTLLLTLARQSGRVVTRSQLSNAVAGRDAGPEDRSVDVLISRLRRKIEPDPKEPRIIVTVPGEGYRFVPRPRTVDPAAEMQSAANDAMATRGASVAANGAMSQSASPPTAAPQQISRFSLPLLKSIAAAALLAVAVLAVVFWRPWTVPTAGTASPARKFDAAAVPFVSDATRRILTT